jgi:hypothetical protein
MASNFGVYKWGIGTGGTTTGGVNPEDLLDLITNVDPYDTPWVTQAPKVQTNHVIHEWLVDTLGDIDTTGAIEGDDYTYVTSTQPSRQYNVTQILRQDVGVSETQRAINPKGFKDAYAYEVQKATKRLAVKLEKLVFASVTTASGASATQRVMKTFQSLITTNTAYAGSGSAASAGVLTSTNFNVMLQTIYVAGGNPEQVYVSPSVKRQISGFTVGSEARNIAATDKKLVNAIDVYDSDFGLIQIVVDRWVPESTNTSVTPSLAADVRGTMFFLQRSMNRLAWLRPMQHTLIGKRGDSVAGIVVGEVTLEVLNEKANGKVVSVNNINA